MYVETDIPSISIDLELIDQIKENLPELPEEKKVRIMAEYNLSEDLAGQLVRRDAVNEFENIIGELEVDSKIVASILAYTLKELEREGHNTEKISLNQLIETFKLLQENKISKDAIPEILTTVCFEECSPLTAAENKGLIKLSESDLDLIIEDIINENSSIIEDRGMGAIGPLMGIAMKKLKGKADGKLINKLLREK